MILDCQNICKAFGTDVILDNISFHLEEKEKMAIVGINGAGKTTLLKIIMGEESADSGHSVKGQDHRLSVPVSGEQLQHHCPRSHDGCTKAYP